MKRKVAIDETQVHDFLTRLFAEDLHAKRILSLSHATLGVVHAVSLSVHAIGQALAWARGGVEKHGIKQVDRLLSNTGLSVWKLFGVWVPYVLGQRREAVVTLDRTDFDHDDQTTLVANLVTQHGRATPLLWLTLHKSAMEGNRAEAEDLVLQRLRECIAADVQVTVLMDRGFADKRLYALLAELDFEYVVRFRKDIVVTSAGGERRTAGDWVPASGHARMLKGARVTAEQVEVPAVVLVHQTGMQEAWCLVTSFGEAKAREVVDAYARRFTCEENFRARQRHPLRDGAVRHAGEEPGASRPSPAGERAGHCALDAAGGGRREPRLRAAAEGEHGQDAHLLPVSPRLHVLPGHAQHEGGAPRPSRRALRSTRARAARVSRCVRPHMRG